MLWKVFADARLLRIIAPSWLKSFIRRHWSVLAYDTYMCSRLNPYRDAEPFSTYETKTQYTLGIIYDITHFHSYYIAACRELKVPYRLIDISVSDWISVIEKSKCDAFLIWPSPRLSIWKDMYEERVKIMTENLKKAVVPSYKEIWLYESKRRVRDWLQAHNIPHPKTWIFYDLDQAMDFLDNTHLPIVYKANFGACARGVMILRNIREAKRKVYKAFTKGIAREGSDPRDRQWGNVILQEYVPHTREWRIVRVGDYYFCRIKTKVGDFASGSGIVDWGKPALELLELVRRITTIGNFSSMNVDLFEESNGRYLVNELHALFGPISPKNERRTNENMGRYVYLPETSEWCFEKGYFYQNACANQRVEYLLKRLSLR